MKLTFRAGTCPDGPCETIYDTDDGQVAVQGTVLTDADALAHLTGMPDHEAVVLISRELIVEYLRETGEVQ